MVVLFYFFYVLTMVKGENLNPSPWFTAIRASAFNAIKIRVTATITIKGIDRVDFISTVRALHKLLILLNKPFFKFFINIAPYNFRAELRAVTSGEGIAVIVYVLKRNDIIIIREELLKRNTCTLDGGIEAEEAIHEVIGSHDVNAHNEVPFRFFLYIVYHGVGYLSS